MKKIAALTLVGALTLVVVVWCMRGSDDNDDSFAAKYRLIQGETTHAKAVQLLGPSNLEFYPGGSLGNHICCWQDVDAGRCLQVTWYMTGQLREKQLRAADRTVILSEQFDFSWRRSWWERVLSSVGLR